MPREKYGNVKVMPYVILALLHNWGPAKQCLVCSSCALWRFALVLLTIACRAVVLVLLLQTMNALVVGTTHRYKGKYITSVLYKPRTSQNRRQQPLHNQPFRQDN